MHKIGMMNIFRSRLATSFIALVMLFSAAVQAPVQASGEERRHEGEMPLRSVSISIAPEAREKLYEALEAYAEEQAFAFRFARLSASMPKFGVEFWRSDIMIGGSNVLEEEIFELHYYSNDCNSLPPDDSLDYQIGRLKAAVETVPDATFALQE